MMSTRRFVSPYDCSLPRTMYAHCVWCLYASQVVRSVTAPLNCFVVYYCHCFVCYVLKHVSLLTIFCFLHSPTSSCLPPTPQTHLIRAQTIPVLLRSLQCVVPSVSRVLLCHHASHCPQYSGVLMLCTQYNYIAIQLTTATSPPSFTVCCDTGLSLLQWVCNIFSGV